MFFKEEINYEAMDTAIPNVFFEQILPIVEPLFLKIYLYGYYLCQKDMHEHFDNKNLAETLSVSLDDVLQAWDFFEACRLIEKHRPAHAEAWDFSVEFKNLRRICTARGSADISIEKDLILSKNEEYQKMYERIEEILGNILMNHQIRTVNEMIAAYNLPKDLVVEAFRFCVYRKGSRSVKHALSILRIWCMEGIRTVEDLNDFFMQKGERYGIYKKILSFLGEYRLPTKAEEELMDKWLDEYRFSVEVIEEAFAKAVAIKSPNMRYVDGILRNWNKDTQELSLQKSKLSEQKDPTLFRLQILEELGLQRKILSRDDMEAIRFLYDHFEMKDILLTMQYMKKLNMEQSVDMLHRLMKNPTLADEKALKKSGTKKAFEAGRQEGQKTGTANGRIGQEEIRDVIEKKRKTKDEQRKEELAKELAMLQQKKEKRMQQEEG